MLIWFDLQKQGICIVGKQVFLIHAQCDGGLRMQQWKVMDVSESNTSWHLTRFVVRNILVAGCLF